MTIMRMKTWWRMVILVASTIVPSLAFAAPSAIDYRIRRLSPGDRYEVTLRFEGDRSGRSTLTIPTSWASAAHAERGIEGLEVMTAQARLEDTDQPQVKRVVHRPGATVVVRYRLKQIAAGDPSATDPAALFLPVIRPRYFAWVGWTSWVIPMADNERRVRVRVAFSGLPSDWEFASSFGLEANAIAYDGPMYAFQAAYFIGGDFRLRSRPARGGPIITAIRGDWSFTDNAFADRVATVIDGERAFWRDDSQRYYMVTLMPLDAPPGFKQSAGTGLTQGFMTQVTKDLTLDQLDFLWTHEYFHTWNNRALGRFPEPQAQLYWFSEGFTDYYMNLLQLRLGLQSLDQYARAYDEAIASLAESPEGHAPNSEVVQRFFSDGDTIGRLPYRRGMLLAAQWDAQIRAASAGRHSLDDAMRTLHDEHRQGVAVLDAARIVRVMRSYGVTNAETDIASQIERGDTARLADGTLTSCISIDDASTPRVDIGFDLRGSTQGGGPVVGVDPDGPAYAAGLRNGQILRTLVSIDRQEHLVEAGYEETPDGEIKTIRYRALGQPVTRQHIAVRADLDDEARQHCLKTLALR